jgi:ryanodine receptor 2
MSTDYQPRPIATDHVRLPVDLLDLVEVLAENAHDLWALERLRSGWRLGSERCDARRLHPCLIPYADLPESEKAYDREVALGTVKAIVALGYTVSRTTESVACEMMNSEHSSDA